MKTTRLFLLAFLSILLVHCSKDSSDGPQVPVDQTDDDPVVQLSSAKELISFSIRKSDNPELKIDADVQQSGTSLKVFFPFETDISDMVVSFQVSEKASLSINGSQMTSGSSKVDFTSSLAVTVEAEDGSTKDFTITSESNFETLDTAIQQLMSDNNAPSMQLAITKGERLVYQAQYGFADINNTEAVSVNSVYRLASVSKVVTAIAILKMKDDGLLDFNDTVFGINGILETDFGSTPYGDNIENITIRHLLDHTSGFANNPTDPMFQNLDWTHQQIIDDVLNNRQLATVPGSTYSYSNFGYIVLGRVVEKLSGMSYEDYVKQNVLQPLGITNMNVARNGIDEKWPNEVEYFSQGDNLGPYQYNAARCEAMGGWTASATDLSRFLVGIDRRGEVADIISTSSMQGMYFEFLEWAFWGSLPATSAVISRLDDEFNFSVVTNTRVIPITLNEKMQNTLKAEIQARSSWPEYDLFDTE